MSNTNKYPYPDCGGDGGNDVHNPSGTHYSSRASCGGSGKERLTITREEYEGLNDQIRRMREVLKLTVQVMDREELVDGRLHIENKIVRARAKAELSQSQSDPVSTKEGGNE